MVASGGSGSQRNAVIDVLRAVAILLVLIAHFPLIPAFSQGSWIGVDLFFVVSGYLISRLLLIEYADTGRVDVLRFLIRRGFKIYPLFYLYVSAAILYFEVFNKPYTWSQVIGDLFFLQNYMGSLMAHTWSLAVEEHYYFGFAGLLAFLSMLRRSQAIHVLPWICLSAMGVCLILRYINITTSEYTALSHHYPTHLRIDSMLTGTLAAYLQVYRPQVFQAIGQKRVLLIPSGLAIALPYVFPIQALVINSIGLLLISPGCFTVLTVMMQSSKTQAFCGNLGMLRFIGKHSYAIYLWHLALRNIMMAVAERLGFGGVTPLTAALYLLVTVLGGVMISLIIEDRVLKYRDRRFASYRNTEDIFKVDR